MKQTAETRRVRSRAFTLVELMIAVVIIGFIAGGLYWRASRSADDLQRKVAIVRARSLDQAKLDYLQASGSTAQTNWSAAATDEARYTLIRSSLHDASAEATLAAYAPPGFSYQFDPSSLTLPTKTLQGATYIDSSSTGKVSLMLTVNDVAAGQVLGGGTYDTGTTVTISAAPFAGYQFVSFTREGVTLSTSSSLDVIVSSTQTIQANFVAAPASNRILTVNRNITSAGTVSPAGGSYSSGSSVTLTATPNAGYQFDSWSGDIGAANPASASLTLTMNQDRVVQANFLRPRVAVIVQPNNAAWGTVSGGGAVPVGTNISISATPMLGYRFDHWQIGATTIATSAAYTYAVTGAATLTAVFAEDTSGATPGTYGSSSEIPVITIDLTGRVTQASRAPIGTMAVQDSNAVAVSGGAINGTPIGATTPAEGYFTNLTVSGAANLGSVTIPAGNVVGGDDRWVLKSGDTMNGDLTVSHNSGTGGPVITLDATRVGSGGKQWKLKSSTATDTEGAGVLAISDGATVRVTLDGANGLTSKGSGGKIMRALSSTGVARFSVDDDGTTTVAGKILAQSLDISGAVKMSGIGVGALSTDASGNVTAGASSQAGPKLRSQEFLSSGTFTPSAALLAAGGYVDVFIVGGGGGGGNSGVYNTCGGGGGGGGVVAKRVQVSGAVAVTIGSGGAAGSNGGDSSFGNLVLAYGGGAGGRGDVPSQVGSGGCGGGGGSYGYYSMTAGGGGGGAGEAGRPALMVLPGGSQVGQYTTYRGARGGRGLQGGGGGPGIVCNAAQGGDGGAGVNGFGGGGGGGGIMGGGTGSSGGGDGGGGYQVNVGSTPTPGRANTGGGGGGGPDTSYGAGAAGGSGYCLVTWVE